MSRRPEVIRAFLSPDPAERVDEVGELLDGARRHGAVAGPIVSDEQGDYMDIRLPGGHGRPRILAYHKRAERGDRHVG